MFASRTEPPIDPGLSPYNQTSSQTPAKTAPIEMLDLDLNSNNIAARYHLS